ncbi:ferric reductase like transmembrane component-domain-containing protein [Bisporella sp. PMI_857]|nr:ferric reductase like transmembrane component-domain-containing protein [Bisporella sp. PMI_857]
MDYIKHSLIARMSDMSEGSYMVTHWGYGTVAMPCTTMDSGTCEYMDVIYQNHDHSMLYSGIFWSIIGGVLFLWAIGRRVWRSPRACEVTYLDSEKAAEARSQESRSRRTIASYIRSYLLPDSIRPIFGRTTRLQVLVLALIFTYFVVFSFVAIPWKVWKTPVKASPGSYRTRSSLGPWSDRIGVFAYALTPLSIMLSSRESILSVLTGIPYQRFNFLHRWLGYIIVLQGVFHTIGWTIIYVKLYQPQPSTALDMFSQTYMIWGIVATLLLLFIFVLSTPWGIRATGYEAFRKMHYVLAMVYIGACWGHWAQLHCFLLPSLLIWFADRAIRLVRSALVHYQYLPSGSMGFKAAEASLMHFPDAENGDVVRLDFKHSQDPWNIGQHFYLCFTECSIWQSHPFTPLNLPELSGGEVAHSYVFRAKKGETKKVADLAARKISEGLETTTSIILSGHYGDCIAENMTPDVNVLCVAGGTGITYVLPVLLSLVRQPISRDRKIELIWAIRRSNDINWIKPELEMIRGASKTHNVAIHIYVTREQNTTPSPSLVGQKEELSESEIKEVVPSSTASLKSLRSLDVRKIGREGQDTHPDLPKMVDQFVGNTVRGPTVVYASGPGSMISDLKTIVAGCNSPRKVWEGQDRYDVTLKCDDRLEW